MKSFRQYLFTLVLISLFSCNPQAEQTKDHEHEHRDENVHEEENGHESNQNKEDKHGQDKVMNSFFAFTDRTEFYVEHQDLVAGQHAQFIVHVTDLQHYKPYHKGKLQLILTIGGEDYLASAAQPDNPGIFNLELNPSIAGNAKLSYIFQLDHDIDTLIRENVKVFEDIHHAHDQEDGLTGHRGINFLKEEAWRSDFLISPVRYTSFSDVIKAGGEFLPLQGERRIVAARSHGIITFSRSDLVQGSEVRKDQSLFRLTGKGLADNNIRIRYEKLSAQYVRTKSEFERHKELYASRVISEKEYIQSKNAFVSDSIEYYNLREEYEEGGLQITSPIKGYIHELNVSEGEYVNPGEVLAIISDNRYLLARVDLPQQYFTQLNQIYAANFRTAYSSKLYSTEKMQGELIARASSVAENDHHMPVYFRLKNDGSLLEGAFAEFYLKTTTAQKYHVVPASSVLEEFENHYVYVMAGGELFEKREVKIAANDGVSVAVSEGLIEGEWIVSRGKMLIKASSMSSSMPAHAHSH